jgi:long-subunit acyl-CoA synthetase (AMP-forming)
LQTYTKEDGSKGEREDTKVVMDNAFQSFTYGQIHERVCNVGSGLCVTLNQIAGASRPMQSPRASVRHIALYAETKGEWMITALACFRNNIIVTTAYATLGLDALAYSLDITDTRVIVTDENLLPQLVSIMEGRQFDDGGKTVQVDSSHLATIIYMPKSKDSKPDPKALAALQNRSAAKGGPINVISFAELEKLGKQFITHEDEYDIDTGKIHAADPGSSARIPSPKSTAMIMFTSGTTGMCIIVSGVSHSRSSLTKFYPL